ncbi:unnamed protein product [Gongylonema pulchrum]|uniref:Col_cuticle_N domain-containing protein n=1 Tax=Gongylonema pulchrum TaxID=637853 RepID=A0A183E658_9BILA|nr:unnamed protein product [Gongylonema pulchrum]
MKVHKVTFIASAVSGITLVACLIAVLSIYSDVQTIWSQLDLEISTFRATTDDLWKDMMRFARKKRFRRQYGGKGVYSGGSNPGNHEASIPSGGLNQYGEEDGNHEATIPPHDSSGYGSNIGPASSVPSPIDVGSSSPSPPPSLAGPPKLQHPSAGKSAGCGMFCDLLELIVRSLKTEK